MAFTYLALNLIFMACAVFLVVRSFHKPGKTWWITFAILFALTLVFDNLAIWAGIFTYAPEKILGIHLGLAPIEDFFYALFAVMLVPALWRQFETIGINKDTPNANN